MRALVRPSSPRAHLAGLGRRIRRRRPTDRASIARAMEGARYVFHVAADYRLWARDRQAIFTTNVDRNPPHHGRSAAPRRRARGLYQQRRHLDLAAGGAAADESMPLAEEDAIGSYKRSKVAAERLVEAMIAEQGLPAVIVNPSTPIGPRDVRPTPTGRIIVAAATGKMPAFVDTGLNLVHVDDVAAGHIAALERGRIGERYILGGGKRAAVADAGRHRRASRPPSAAHQHSLARGDADCGCVGSHGLGDRARATGHDGRRAAGEIPHVLHAGQGCAGTRLSRRGPIARACATPCSGLPRPANCRGACSRRACPNRPAEAPPSGPGALAAINRYATRRAWCIFVAQRSAAARFRSRQKNTPEETRGHSQSRHCDERRHRAHGD